MAEQAELKVGDTAYLSKYALSSKGCIRKYEVKDVSDGGYVSVRLEGFRWDSWFKVSKEIHATEAEAIAACEQARIKREASLRKQLDALSKLKFEVVGDE